MVWIIKAICLLATPLSSLPTNHDGKHHLNIVVYFGLINQISVYIILRCADRWYSMEYERFYLDPGTSFTFRVSGSASGDAGDMVMNIGSPVNGSPFTTSGIYCFASYGPWWYTGAEYCCHCQLFGQPSTVSWEQIGTLSAARMMVRLVQ
jgi:hypothetical protein